MTDEGKEREETVAALVDAIWEERYGGVTREGATAEARALLREHDARTTKARDLEWNDACLQATASLKSVGLPCSPTAFEIGRLVTSVRVAALGEAESLLRACAASDVSCPTRDAKATAEAVAEEIHSWIAAALSARAQKGEKP